MALEVALQALTGLSVFLMLGLILTIFAKKLHISSLFLLLIGGFILSILQNKGFINLLFSDVLLISLALITLVVVVFDGSSKFTLKRVETYSISSLKVMLSFILFSSIILSPFIALLFFGKVHLQEILFGFIIAVTISGTDPTSVFRLIKYSANKSVQILELESIFNTPFTIILPLIALEIIRSAGQDTISSVILGQLSPLVLQITAGIGVGVLFGFFISKMIRNHYSKELSPIILLASALLAYILAESIGGSGVLSVATMGLFFGNTIIRNKEDMQRFNELLGSIFVMLVFVLVGFLVDIHFTLSLVLKSIILYILALFIRFQVIHATIRSAKFTWKERLFMTLLIPKGIAVAVVVFSLAVMQFDAAIMPLLQTTTQIIVLIMALSLLVATIVARFSHYFLQSPEAQEEKREEDSPGIIKAVMNVEEDAKKSIQQQRKTKKPKKIVVKSIKKSPTTTTKKSLTKVTKKLSTKKSPLKKNKKPFRKKAVKKK
ncbi:cation:proton antiporter [Candidatus Woesearchaeota archaeon]|nr:cation:proton antiporter [Candidatus Woesearchaeota archaeon]